MLYVREAEVDGATAPVLFAMEARAGAIENIRDWLDGIYQRQAVCVIRSDECHSHT